MKDANRNSFMRIDFADQKREIRVVGWTVHNIDEAKGRYNSFQQYLLALMCTKKRR